MMKAKTMKRSPGVEPFSSEIRSLKKLISAGEGQHLEFKTKATFPDKIVQEMIAFANASGGTLLVGVNDDGHLTGLKNAEGESHVIQNSILKCKPKLRFTEKFIDLNDKKKILLYEIPEGDKKPYQFVSESGKSAFIRVLDKSIKVSRELHEILRRKGKKKDIKFRYGDEEQLLMQYLDKNSAITLQEFMKIANLNRFHSSRKLILLVLANVLAITPQPGVDYYSLSNIKKIIM